MRGMAGTNQKSVLVLSLLAALANAQTDKHKVIEYIGKGYDIVVGDPHANGFDPGWRAPVINTKWILEEYEDRVNDVNFCSYDSIASAISGSESAQTSMKKTWSDKIDVDFPFLAKIAYTSSKSVQSMSKSALESETHFFEAVASCQLYQITMPPPFLKYNFTDEFVAAVSSLDWNSTDPSSAMTVVEAFGTHISRKVAMGGQMVFRWHMEGAKFHSYKMQAQSSGWSVEAGAQGMFWKYASPSGDYESHINADATTAFEQASSGTAVEQLYFGGTPFVKDDASKWFEGLHDSLAPIGGGQTEALLSIGDLLTPVNFPDDPNIKYKRDYFNQAIQDACPSTRYISDWASCTQAPVDPEGSPCGDVALTCEDIAPCSGCWGCAAGLDQQGRPVAYDANTNPCYDAYCTGDICSSTNPDKNCRSTTGCSCCPAPAVFCRTTSGKVGFCASGAANKAQSLQNVSHVI